METDSLPLYRHKYTYIQKVLKARRDRTAPMNRTP